MLTRNGPSATITCTVEARPEPSFKVFLNETILVINDKTYTIPEVNRTHVGNYKCVAENVLGNASSDPEYLSLGNRLQFLSMNLNIYFVTTLFDIYFVY